MKSSRYLSYASLSVLALMLCSVNAYAAGVADGLHFADDYPACSFSPVDAETGNPVSEVFALAQWYKNVSVMEYTTKSCRESFRVRSDGPVFSIPAARCPGFRHGTTLSVRVKASGYRTKEFRIMRRPKRSDPPHNTYLPIEDCGKAVQRLPLERIKSLSEALDQYRIRYNRDLMAAVFGSSEAFYERVISELRGFDPGLDVAGARKSYCEAALKDIPRDSPRARWAEPYCKDPE